MKKTQPKKTKQSVQSRRPSKRQLFWIVALSVLVVGSILFAVVNQIGINNDRERFEAVEKKKSAVVDQLVSYLGENVTASREQNECFNTEQGPFDNGKLWCQVATIFELKQDVDFMKLGSVYLSIGKNVLLKPGSDEGIFPRYWLTTGQNVSCQLEYKSSDGRRDGGSTRIPFNDDEPIAVAVTCADRAKAKHYQYVE